MASIPNLVLRVPGERIALEVMRQTLQEIVEARRAEPWGYTGGQAADAAAEALAAVAVLEGE